jgi:hypothetical protein
VAVIMMIMSAMVVTTMVMSMIVSAMVMATAVVSAMTMAIVATMIVSMAVVVIPRGGRCGRERQSCSRYKGSEQKFHWGLGMSFSFFRLLI